MGLLKFLNPALAKLKQAVLLARLKNPTSPRILRVWRGIRHRRSVRIPGPPGPPVSIARGPGSYGERDRLVGLLLARGLPVPKLPKGTNAYDAEQALLAAGAKGVWS